MAPFGRVACFQPYPALKRWAILGRSSRSWGLVITLLREPCKKLDDSVAPLT